MGQSRSHQTCWKKQFGKSLAFCQNLSCLWNSKSSLYQEKLRVLQWQSALQFSLYECYLAYLSAHLDSSRALIDAHSMQCLWNLAHLSFSCFVTSFLSDQIHPSFLSQVDLIDEVQLFGDVNDQLHAKISLILGISQAKEEEIVCLLRIKLQTAGLWLSNCAFQLKGDQFLQSNIQNLGMQL